MVAIEIIWQSEASGRQSRREFRLLGEVFVLTYVGDVIVDSAWLMVGGNCRRASPELAKAFADALCMQEKSLSLRLLTRGTAYSRSVWLALTKIPCGQVMTYSELAKQVKSGARAVAQACRNNPYPGIIPCHRVVAKTGSGGFMGQNQGAWVDFKQRLLKYERAIGKHQYERLCENH